MFQGFGPSYMSVAGVARQRMAIAVEESCFLLWEILELHGGLEMGSKTSINGEFPSAMFDCSWLISVFADGSYSNQGILPHITRPRLQFRSLKWPAMEQELIGCGSTFITGPLSK